MNNISGSILIVDDDAVIRRILSLSLEMAGHRVKTAVDGQQAIDQMRAEPFDLVMLDVMMPVMDGYDVLLAMQQDEQLAHIPVIVVSASSQVESAIRCIELGAVDYVSKPFNSVLLHTRVQSSLQKKRYWDQERAHRAHLESMIQAVQAANEAKSEFVSVVSHELRAPMATLWAYKDLIERLGQLEPKQQMLLDKMELSLQRMRNLVTDLDHVSRLENGNFELEFGPVTLAEVVQSVVDSLAHQIADKQHTVTVAIPSSLPQVWADDARLTQILTNLVSNAVKYTPPQGEISVTAVPDPVDPSALQITVQDNGFGIRAEDQAGIFGKFFRSDAAEIRAQEGTGLGLNITRHLVERHSGRIWFESAAGQGTAFHFTLPLAEAMKWPEPAQHATVSRKPMQNALPANSI